MNNKFFLSAFAKKSRFHWDFFKDIDKLNQWEELSENFSYFTKDPKSKRNKKNKIPKIIHQIWIGPKDFPNKYSVWANSWKKFNPSWDYMFWTEVEINKLVLKNQKLYDMSENIGYKSDIARYEILERYGGIYVDTDFECIRPIPEDFLNFDFVSCTVFSNKPEINNAIMMSKVSSRIIKKIISNIKIEKDFKDPIKTIKSSGAIKLTEQYFSLKKEEKKECLILPSNYFYPYPNFLINKFNDVYKFVTSETIGIHHWEMSWMKGSRLKRGVKKLINFLRMKKK